MKATTALPGKPLHRPRQRSDPHLKRLCGVDGCKYGWISLRCMDDFSNVEWRVARSWTELEIPAGAVVAVDMPIGLAAAGKRGCDEAARKAPHMRPSSIFPMPVRGALDHATYADANAWSKANGHGGVVKQAWNLKPKLLDLETAVRAQTGMYESHPELAFARLAGCALPAKKTLEGRNLRLKLLRDAGLTGLPAILRAVPKAQAAPDDILDAAVLLIAARRIRNNEAQIYGDPARLSTLNRPMTIWV
jgi:predicted RNase H-like nuclease